MLEEQCCLYYTYVSRNVLNLKSVVESESDTVSLTVLCTSFKKSDQLKLNCCKGDTVCLLVTDDDSGNLVNLN